MFNISYKILEKRQKNQIKIFAILCGVLFLATATFSYLKWQQYSMTKIALENGKTLIETLRKSETDAISRYNEKKVGFADLQKNIEEKLASVFPDSDEYTTLTKQLDAFESELSKTKSAFEVSHIDFENVTVNEHYAVLPFRMSVRSSAENFKKFLHMMESSGSLDSGVRLMEVSSIRLNFGENAENEESKIIDFTLSVNAYFQKTT